MPDQKDGNFSKVSTELYKHYCQMRDTMVREHLGLAKWLIATLVAVHGGALIATSQLGDKAGPVFAASGIWFLSGLMIAVATGFCAWLNFQFSSLAYRDWADPKMMQDPKFWPTGTPYRGRIESTLWLAGIFGFVSWCLIAVGAYEVYGVYQPQAEITDSKQ